MYILENTTKYNTTILREQYNDTLCLNQEANEGEMNLSEKLGNALPDLSLKRFQNTYLNNFNNDIATNLVNLFTTYGNITP